MSTVHAPLGGRVDALAGLPQDTQLAFVKGAVDGLLALTTHVWDGDAAVPLDDDWHRRIRTAHDELAAQGLRLLGVAFRPRADAAAGDVERDLTLIGLVGIIDPPRAEVADAVARCRAAGIRPIMITGDHPVTAGAIARQIGIATDDRILTGADLDRLSDAKLDRAAGEVSVFARVSPEHKLRIVRSLQGRGEVVAMTGDGVNDAPALKRSDIGVAMGITGTDVSKEASDVVLRDDDFTTIVAAVEEGRVIYDNLRRFVSFAVAGNIGKILVVLGWPVPLLLGGGDVVDAVALLPLQLLWLNLMTDGLLGLSMGVEPAERSVMRRPPNPPAPACGRGASAAGRCGSGRSSARRRWASASSTTGPATPAGSRWCSRAWRSCRSPRPSGPGRPSTRSPRSGGRRTGCCWPWPGSSSRCSSPRSTRPCAPCSSCTRWVPRTSASARAWPPPCSWCSKPPRHAGAHVTPTSGSARCHRLQPSGVGAAADHRRPATRWSTKAGRFHVAMLCPRLV
jgi:soluble P-type ATPase